MLANIAVIGVGRWGQHVARNLHELGALAAYVDVNSVSFLDDLGIKRLSFEEFLASDIKAAWVATPSVYHFEQVKALLQHRKSVMVEKPMTLSIEDADLLQEIADNCGCHLLVDYLLCYHPAVSAMQHHIKSASYGQVSSIQIRRRNSIPIRDYETVWWDLGIHDLAWLYELFKAPFSDISGMQCATYRQEFVDQAIVISKIGEIDVVHDVCWSSPIKEASIAVYTDQGLLFFNDLEMLNHKLVWYSRCSESGLLSSDATAIELIDSQPLKQSCIHFIDVVAGNAIAKTTHKNYRPVMQALESFSVQMTKT